ncbi:Chain length determinant protein [Franzmannia pantelleriensis]|uniref:Chain length determinant protein n=1 Tax=Franzmannia pantelleriensis TaxID=48727 RepID=A0A1G9ECM4_9GAMM|nr:Wzz/FepE/Etk N-terminal domain-containing protein [Halomonas pantelleriensis]SDK73833.1 Chain length determinant protein [Halomonas pantelleriensis]
MANPSPDSDEISLVDLAVTVVRHWLLLLGTFLIVTAAAVGYALMQTTAYHYTSLFQFAEYQDAEGARLPLVAAGGVLGQFNVQHLPAATRAYLEETQRERVGFDVSAELLSDTRILRVRTTTSPEREDEVEALHLAALTRLESAQQQRLERLEASLQQRLDAAEAGLADASGERASQLAARVAELEAQLAGLVPAELSEVATRSSEPVAQRTGLIIALGAMLGLMLGLMAVFVRQFAHSVRQSLHKRA